MLRLPHKVELRLKSTIFLLSPPARDKANALTQRSNSVFAGLFTIRIQCAVVITFGGIFLNQCTVWSNSRLKQLMVTSFPLHGRLFSPVLRGLTLILVWHGCMMHICFDCWASCLSVKSRKKRRSPAQEYGSKNKPHGPIRQAKIEMLYIFFANSDKVEIEGRWWIKVG